MTHIISETEDSTQGEQCGCKVPSEKEEKKVKATEDDRLWYRVELNSQITYGEVNDCTVCLRVK